MSSSYLLKAGGQWMGQREAVAVVEGNFQPGGREGTEKRKG